ncbi:MAG: hypothetical protein ACKVX7_17725 [Planctomycetota bacterium]
MPRSKGMMKFGPSGNKAPKKSAGKETRRKFSLDDKRRILAEIDSAPRGSKGAVLERYGLHSPAITKWRKRVGKTGKASPSAARKVGRLVGGPRRASSGAPMDTTNLVKIVRENSALRAEVAALRSRMEQVKRFVAIQRQLAGEMLGAV